jgi:tRNA nucleotidyltransferase/poly(A) polymerase
MLNFVVMKIKKFDTFLESKNDLYDIVPQSIKDISILFKENGKELYLVGGAVRDFINNENPKDFDLCTNATPDEILNIVKNKYKTTEQGKSFGVIVIYTKDQPMGIEVATFREDVYDDKLGITRNPEIKFSTIEKDVLRRDITYNSMFYDLEKRKIIDLVGGIEDIKNKITRFVGNPNDRITEDPLRILRALRFSCRYNFVIDLDTKKSIIKNKNKLSIISQERIWEEMKKAAKQAKNYSEYLELFNEFDMWGEVFPGAVINTKIEESDSFITYIANLFKFDNISDLEKRMVIEYKIEYDIASKVVFLINLLKLTPDSAFDLYKQKIKCHCSTDLIVDWLDINKIHKKIFIRFIDYVPSVSAEDLIAKGFKGKPLGDEIKRLEIEKFKELIND